MEEPFFSQKLLRVAPDGSYQAFSGSDRIAAFNDRIEISGAKIYYPCLLAIEACDNVLRICYVAADNRRAERYFRWDTFLPGKAPRLLEQFVTSVEEKAGQSGLSLAVPPAGSGANLAATEVRYAELLKDFEGRPQITVFSPLVSFPALCPGCGSPPTTVGRLVPGCGLTAGLWHVPSCAAHTDVARHVRVLNWTPRSTALTFRFSNLSYSASFLAINSLPLGQRHNTAWDKTDLAQAIANGARFVVYEYALGAIYIAMLRVSKPKLVKRGFSRMAPGLPYSLLSMLAGWWAIPSGPLFTIRALVTNSKGGADISSAVLAILSGQAISA